MLYDNIITRYGISDRSTEYRCAMYNRETEVVRWEDQERESQKRKKIYNAFSLFTVITFIKFPQILNYCS